MAFTVDHAQRMRAAQHRLVRRSRVEPHVEGVLDFLVLRSFGAEQHSVRAVDSDKAKTAQRLSDGLRVLADIRGEVAIISSSRVWASRTGRPVRWASSTQYGSTPA